MILSHLIFQVSSSYYFDLNYSHLSNKCGGWNKRGGEAKKFKSLNMEAETNVEVGNIYEMNKRGGGILFCGG